MISVNSNEPEKDFLSLYKKYYSCIYGYIAKKLFNRELAEDMTSATFLKALDHISRKNPKIENFRAWIYKIATNEINQHHRYMKGKNNLSLDDEESNFMNFLPANNGDGADRYIDFITVKKALERLKPEEKTLIELYYFENLDYSEISRVMNKKESTLRSMVCRALKKIESLMGN